MLSNSSNSPPIDHLTGMLHTLRLDGIEYGRRHLDGSWAFSFPQKQHAYFHFVGGRACWLLTPGGEWLELLAGDAVLLPRGGAHALASEPSAVRQPFPQWQCRPLGDDVYDPSAMATGSNCLLFYGSMRFNLDSLHPLLGMMPDVMRAKELMRHEPATLQLLDAMACEMAANRVGACGIVARLADVLAAQIIRSWVEYGCVGASGWIAAVRHPQIGRALAAIHSHTQYDWTVEKLADLIGVSRSGFAAKFANVVGETPAQYIAQIRMHQARDWIVRDNARISDVSQRLGYESEASFSRAFKRVMGVPPSHYRSANVEVQHTN
jgi:AraC-like DNA-binding protein